MPKHQSIKEPTISYSTHPIRSELQLDVDLLLCWHIGETLAGWIQNQNVLFLVFILDCHSFLLFFALSLLAALLHRPSIESDFCVAELLFLFVPFSPWLPACRLAAPCVKGGCNRTDCGNSRLASLGPRLPNQRGSHQSSTPPALAHTLQHKRPTKLILTQKTLQRSHPLPIILGSNFISTRVAAHCRQPLQSFLINSRFVPHPSFWTHLSYIPISAAPSTPRQPPFANPTASPHQQPHPKELLLFFFFPTCRSPTCRVR